MEGPPFFRQRFSCIYIPSCFQQERRGPRLSRECRDSAAEHAQQLLYDTPYAWLHCPTNCPPREICVCYSAKDVEIMTHTHSLVLRLKIQSKLALGCVAEDEPVSSSSLELDVKNEKTFTERLFGNCKWAGKQDTGGSCAHIILHHECSI